MKNITNIFSSEILFPFPMPNIKTKQICDIQLEHSRLIINPNVPRKNIFIGHNMTIILLTCQNLSKSYATTLMGEQRMVNSEKVNELKGA